MNPIDFIGRRRRWPWLLVLAALLPVLALFPLWQTQQRDSAQLAALDRALLTRAAARHQAGEPLAAARPAPSALLARLRLLEACAGNDIALLRLDGDRNGLRLMLHARSNDALDAWLARLRRNGLAPRLDALVTLDATADPHGGAVEASLELDG